MLFLKYHKPIVTLILARSIYIEYFFFYFDTGSVSVEDNQPPAPAPAVPDRTDLQPVKVRAGVAVELLELLRIK